MIDKDLIQVLTILAYIICCSAVCIGIHASFQYKYSIIDNKFEFKMLFGGVARLLDRKNLPDFITYPLYKCPACMTTIYTPLTWFCLGNSFTPELLVVWAAVGGVNWFIAQNYNV